MRIFTGKCDKKLAKLIVRQLRSYFMLREKLLGTFLFEENEYFEKYLELINCNLETKQQKFKTQKHHIIPRIAFQLYNWDGCELKENKVNLIYSDHILAHYYLALAAKESAFKYRMICAINFILGKATQVKLDVENLKTFTLNLDKYQQLYEESKKYFADQIRGTTHFTSEETKQKISKSNSGRIYVNKDGIVRSLKDRDEVDLFLANGWVLGNPNNQNRDTKKGCTVVHKGDIEKYIKKEELQEYLDNGWLFGRTDAHKKATAKATAVYMQSISTEERKKFGHACPYKGQSRPNAEEIYKKVSAKTKGRKQSEEQRLQNSSNKTGCIWLTNGLEDIMIRPEKEPEFVILGYYRGRSKNRKNYEK